MAMDGSRERSLSLPSPAFHAKRCRCPDDDQPSAATPKRRKRHHGHHRRRCHAASPPLTLSAVEVEEGQILLDGAAAAAMDVDTDSAAPEPFVNGADACSNGDEHHVLSSKYYHSKYYSIISPCSRHRTEARARDHSRSREECADANGCHESLRDDSGHGSNVRNGKPGRHATSRSREKERDRVVRDGHVPGMIYSQERYGDDTTRQRESKRVRDERWERERRSGGSRHNDHERRRDSGKDRHDRVDSALEGQDKVGDSDRHRDFTRSIYSTSDGCKQRPRSGEKDRDVDRKNQSSEEMKGNCFKEKDEEYQEGAEQQIAMQEEDDPEKIEEESRRRKEAIMMKYRQQQLQKQLLESVTSGNNEEVRAVDGDEKAHLKDDNDSRSMANNDAENKQGSSEVAIDKANVTVGKSRACIDILPSAGTLGNKSEKSAVTICDGIFGGPPAGTRKLGKDDGLHIGRNVLYHDNWDDAEGYYNYRFGELLDGRYEIIAAHGKGVFSRVVRARDLKSGKGDAEKVAIKIIRNNDTMYKAGKQEVSVLEKLTRADREDKLHCVRFISNFRYRNHLCLVLESLDMNLREVLKKFGRNIGLKLSAVRAYSKQLFISLKHLKNCKVLHCDIKPDNILVNKAKNVLKLCDFGNAMLAGTNEVTPYLVSRFYRAPEIILGLPYDHPLDMWSVGCCLYEIYTGEVLFPGESNNDMLRLHMELKGPFPKKMLRKGAFTMQHFNRDLKFQATYEDPMTKKVVRRLILNIKQKGIGSFISNFPGEDRNMLSSFKDLLDKIFVLDPAKRITVTQALSHPFITGK